MEIRTQRKCPMCGTDRGELLRSMRLADFDGGNPLCTFSVISCPCGFAFNDLKAGRREIEEFYDKNQLYPAQMGVGSGGLLPLDIERYQELLEFITPQLPHGHASLIIDVGCAKGGFLQFLQQNEFDNLIAIDANAHMIEAIKQEHGIAGKQGMAHALPIADGQAEGLVYSNILEHLYDLNPVIAEADRALSSEGILIIEVPDASRYSQSRIADFYWFSQCEHINHFDAHSLRSLLAEHSFIPVALEQTMMRLGKNGLMPLIRGVFKRGEKSAQIPETNLREQLAEYIEKEERILSGHKIQVDEMRINYTPLFIWGRGLELQCLYTEAGLGRCTIQCIIDNNPAKQGPTIDGLTITSQEVLTDADPSTTVVIVSALHKESMIEHLHRSQYPGKIVCLT